MSAISAGSGEIMSEHRFERVDLHRSSTFVARCSCGWRSVPATTAGMAGARWDDHGRVAAGDGDPQPIVHVDMAVSDAARELYADLMPVLKDAVRAGAPSTVAEGMRRLEDLAAVLGAREARLASAVGRQWARLVEDNTPRQRATVIVGLVELGERAREHLSRGLPAAPERLRADSNG